MRLADTNLAGLKYYKYGAQVFYNYPSFYNAVKNMVGVGDAGKAIVFGSDTKSAAKLESQMTQRGWTESTVKDVVSSPYTIRDSKNLSTGNPATVYYNKSGGYVIIDDVTKEVVQVSDNINPSAWIPDKNIINPYKP